MANKKYQREIKPGVWVDVYDVLRAFAVTDQALGHLIKKALAVGQRGHKDALQDYTDIRDSAERALEIHKEKIGVVSFTPSVLIPPSASNFRTWHGKINSVKDFQDCDATGMLYEWFPDFVYEELIERLGGACEV